MTHDIYYTSLRNYLLILIIFAFAYILKIYGYWDFSSRYNIKEIICTNETHNSLLLIDNEIKSAWGAKHLTSKNEHISIFFRKFQKIDSLSIIFYNLGYFGIKSSPKKIKIYKFDQGDWNEIKYSEEILRHDDKIEQKIVLNCITDAVRIQYQGDENQYWIISEINFDFIR